MKPTVLFPIFNKSQYVERGLRSCLKQTEPCEIIIFGPPSTDGTDEIIREILRPEKINEDAYKLMPYQDHSIDFDYTHKIRWFRPPINGYAGSNAGMNADFNWIMDKVTGDFCLFTSADDVMAPTRVEKVKAVFEEHNPSWVVNAQTMMREDGTVQGVVPGIEGQGWIDMTQGIKFQVGSSGGFAWATDLYRKYAPINHIESNDVVLPTLALLERGMYYIDEPLQTMYLHDDLNNLGLEGQVRGATSPAHALQLNETMAFQGTSNWTSVLKRMEAHHSGRQYPPEFLNTLYQRIFDYASWWVDQRAQLTMQKIKPLAFGAKALGLE